MFFGLVECRADRGCGGHGLGRRSGLQPRELPCVRRRVIRARARSCWDYARKLGEEAVGAYDAAVLSAIVRMGCAHSQAKCRSCGKKYRLHIVRPFGAGLSKVNRLRHERDVGKYS
jgi:hypothetical protein